MKRLVGEQIATTPDTYTVQTEMDRLLDLCIAVNSKLFKIEKTLRRNLTPANKVRDIEKIIANTSVRGASHDER